MTTTPALTGAERTAAKIGYLSKTDLFQDLTPPELAEIERKITMHRCERGRVFYLPGETGEVLYILKEGRVQLYRLSAEGRKLVIATLEPGTIFGEMSMIGQGMYDAFAEAAEPCMICVMRRRGRCCADPQQAADRPASPGAGCGADARAGDPVGRYRLPQRAGPARHVAAPARWR